MRVFPPRLEIYARGLFGAGFVVLATLATAFASPAAQPVQLEVDASDVTHGIQHAHEVIPVVPGPLTLSYPKWIPGEHRPNGPITQLVNLKIKASGRTLVWRRDPFDAFLFHLDVPPGASALDLRFDYVSPPHAFGPGFGQSPASTGHLLVIEFNTLLLYPLEASAQALEIGAKVKIPTGWRFDNALPPARVDGAQVLLPVVTIAELVDSPLLAGENLRTLGLTAGPGAARISIAGDSATDLEIAPNTIASLSRLPGEANAVFGPGHYRDYAWLVALSNRLAHDGLEHQESSDVREDEGLFSAPEDAIDWVLFPHEYVHAWNGKYRRPADMATRNFQQPTAGDLLWVYEGLTRYYGDFVLATRSGLLSPEDARAYLGFVGAQMDEDRPGRLWRPLADTATAAPAFADAPAAWGALRRGADYYNEMLLIWLEVDTAIRQATHGERSLDDVCLRFFSGPERAPAVRPYGRSDVVAALAAVSPRNWDGFLAERIDAVAPRAPLAGLRASGWRLTYSDDPNAFVEKLQRKSSVYDLSHSLGLWIKADGVIQDVVPGSPGFNAGAAPGQRVVEVAGQPFTIEAATAAIIRSETASDPIDLLVASGDVIGHLRVNQHQGLRNPHLVRDPVKPNLLGAILAPRAGGPSAKDLSQ